MTRRTLFFSILILSFSLQMLIPINHDSMVIEPVSSASESEQKLNKLREENFQSIRLDVPLPTPLSSAGIASNGSHSFIFGGTSNSWEGRSEIYVFSLQTHKFEVIGNLPVPNYAMGIVQIENKVYLIGGFHNGTTNNQIICFDLETYTFIEINTILPFGLEKPRCLLYNDEIYILGGKDFNSPDPNVVIFRYDTISDTLREMNSKLPEFLFHPGTHIVDSNIIIFGGFYLHTRDYSREIYTFDIEEDSLIKEEYLLEKELRPDGTLIRNEFVNILGYWNESGFINSILKFDPITFSLDTVSNNVTDLDLHGFCVTHDDFFIYLLGGVIYKNYLAESFIYRLNYEWDSSVDVVDKEDFDPQNWDISDENIFRFNKLDQYMEWNCDPCVRNASRELNYITKEGDCFELEIQYFNHSDPNSRQNINFGWTDDLDFNFLRPVYDDPSPNFIGVNVLGVYNFINIRAKFTRDNQTVYHDSLYLEPNKTHTYRFQAWIINRSHFLVFLTVNGNYISEEIISGDLTGITLTDFAIWNQGKGSLECQGTYNGTLVYARILSNVQNPHNPSWYNFNIEDYVIPVKPIDYSGFFVFIFFLILLASLITFILIKKPEIRYYFKNNPPVEIPRGLVTSRFFTLYRDLDLAFNRLNRIVAGDPAGGTVPSGNIVFTKSTPFSSIDQSSTFQITPQEFTNLTNISLRVLIYLLEYLDHGTYLSSLEIDLDLPRTTLAYNLEKLEELGLTQKKNPPASYDQRFKIISISNEGVTFLYRIYLQLDKYFNS